MRNPYKKFQNSSMHGSMQGSNVMLCPNKGSAEQGIIRRGK